MAVPYTFGSATTSIPLSQLDSNFATTITLGNTAIQLGNTVTTLNNMTLANVTISSGTSNLASTSISNGTSNVTIASSGGNIAMATNGTTGVIIDTSQSVAIGSTSTASATRLTLKGSGTGSSTLFSCQNSGGTALLTLSENGNLSFNSGYGSNATAYGCRAWVNFNGTGTVAIRGSANVSSITDNGVGDYTVNFTTSMVDENYSTVSMGGRNPDGSGGEKVAWNYADRYSTSSVRIVVVKPDGSAFDQPSIFVAVFR